MGENAYKETIRLPRTGFAMKADLPSREPGMLAEWSSTDIYGRIREARAGAPRFVLHDGPPYANGSVHLGTAFNKILKDFIIKSHTMMGFDSPYIPGWDCHGMPIEHRVTGGERDGGRSMPRGEVRARCREYASRHVGIQKEEFRRLGVFGLWDEPYLTMSRQYESGIIRAFAELVRRGYVYQGLRPISWCTTCSTALADAEVEYADRSSCSIWVGFLQSDPAAWGERGVPPGVEVAIWTTTPWTLPANMAVALNPAERYAVIRSGGRRLLVAGRRAEAVLRVLGGGEIEPGPGLAGSALEGLLLRHPLFPDRTSLMVTGEHVTMDDGTGCVHTAPGHGAEDFATGQRYSLETFSPVDAAGVFTVDAGPYAGMAVEDANARITADLASSGRLLAESRIAHSYPHCWRCHKPLIFRATRQFFLDLSRDGLKDRVLDSVDSIRWIPSWGYDRMKNMMAARPDWCLSRQRAWGVALPAFTCRDCGLAVLDPGVMDAVAGLVAEEGSDAWFDHDPAFFFELAGSRAACPGCGSDELDRVDDILDVWFDSSLSHYNVLDASHGLERPCEVYLEATDQHRGWFGVSLITSIALGMGIPARNIITHGLILDRDGKKMSKSLGNAISPFEIIDTMGADILRLWFAGVDYTADFKADRAVLEDSREAYRKLRNTVRFMLGNLDAEGSEPGPPDRLAGLDRWIFLRFRQAQSECLDAYRTFQFHRVFRELRNLATVDLSGIFLDVRKDRLYCDDPDSGDVPATRRLLGWMTVELLKLLAPLVPFTAEEAWRELPGWLRDAESVHLSLFSPLPLEPSEEEELAGWEPVLDIRRGALKSLEEARAAGLIGGGLEAEIALDLPPGLEESALGERWEDLLIVSSVRTSNGGAGAHPVTRAASPRCDRCWKHLPGVVPVEGGGALCGRCSEVLRRAGHGRD